MRKCVYCGVEISQDSVVDFCEKCGKNAFGEKLFYTILENMKHAKERGDLEQCK